MPNSSIIPDDPFGKQRKGKERQGVSAAESQFMHQRADTDSSWDAIHHTLGNKATQAAAGNHDHLRSQTPRCIVFQTSAQLFNNGTPTATIWGDTVVDTHNFWDASESNLLRCRDASVAGLYHVVFSAGWENAAAFDNIFSIRHSGVEQMYSRVRGQDTHYTATSQAYINIGPNESVQGAAYQASGGNINSITSIFRMSIVRVSAL